MIGNADAKERWSGRAAAAVALVIRLPEKNIKWSWSDLTGLGIDASHSPSFNFISCPSPKKQNDLANKFSLIFSERFKYQYNPTVESN